MNNPKHTKGPWLLTFDKRGVLSLSDKGTYVQVAKAATAIYVDGTGSHEINEETAKANARLIAAAPELLEALDKLVTRVANDEKISKHDEGLHRCIALIRKATGESND